MEIKTASFVSSFTSLKKLPRPDKPEYAFIGRSNVGKSSLINYLCGRNKLAKVSSTPGKTQTINHFIINEKWYLVDLPGYGYAKVSREKRELWSGFIKDYLMKRDNLVCTFVLADARHKPLENDIEFMYKMGANGIPFAIVFTKADKLKPKDLESNLEEYKKELKKYWSPLPELFVTSSEKKKGKEEILAFIGKYNGSFTQKGRQ
ncbi:MAG: ribosome biogenesis GTP-binding protein YihA/YsxC [Bacteroidota bacterium]